MKLQKYNLQIDNKEIQKTFRYLINQTWKLLPMREQGSNWIKLLDTLLELLVGMKRLISCQGQEQLFFILICKLQGLHQKTEDQDFDIFRRTIFQSLSLLNALKKYYDS